MPTNRILYLVASSHGGAATHLRNLALGLPPDRYAATVAMPLDDGNVLPADFANSPVKFVPLEIAGGFAWSEIFRLHRLLAEGQFDLLHLHGARSALYGRLAAAMLSKRPKIVFSIHGFATPFHPQPKRLIYLTLERLLQRLTDHTIAVAQAEADLFCSFGLARPDKISFIHYGIDLDRFTNPPLNLAPLRAELGLSEADQVILTVCRLNVPRDFVSLLTAFAQVQANRPAARLLIVGDGPQRAEVESLIRDHNLTQQVQITGFRSDVPALMALARVYVLTSYGWEGYPISTLEAQASGLPAVVTDAGGSKEAVLDEQTGLVVPKQRPDRLAQAIERLLADEALHQRLGQAGQSRAQEQFSRARMVEKIMVIYERLL